MAQRLPRGYRAETSTEVKRSRFICTLGRADSEDEARELIASVRRQYPDARHHCTAFIVEVPGAHPVERSSDDGEPSGTAGRPMLDVLRGSGVTQAVAVVTRYFGGVKLGTGGLVRAYSDAVAAALAVAPRVTAEVREVFAFEVGHADAGRVRAELLDAGVLVAGVDYGERVRLRVAAPEGEELAGLVAQVVRGEAELKPAGTLEVEREV